MNRRRLIEGRISLPSQLLAAVAVFLVVLASSLASSWPAAATTSEEKVSQDSIGGRFSGKNLEVQGSKTVKERIRGIRTDAVEVIQTTEKKVGETLVNDKITILTPYCFTLRGTGQLDCFDIERSICLESGSQYVIRAFYMRNEPDTVVRYGAPFCSDPADPVITDPAADAPEAPPMPVVTLADFRRLDIAPSQIESDTGGFGLIRAHTNFYATEEPQTLETTMLGQDVSIQAVPVRWTWDYGDGSEAVSNPHPGGPQREFNQETTTSHAYQETGEFPVSLSTSYRGQFSVNGGPWIAIPGTADVPSEPVSADIWRSRSKNVAEDCVANPQGWACEDPFVED